jgi:flagellar hook assembly protein FlgD
VVDIFWTLSEAAQVTIEIHNSVDRYIVTLASEPLDPGQWYIPWDGGNRFGSLVGRGTYRYIIRATDAAGNTGEATGTATLRRPKRRF